MTLKVTSFRPQSKLLWPLWVGVWGPINLIIAFIPLAFFNIMQFFSVFLRPFSHAFYDQYNTFCASLVWGWWAWGVQKLVGVKVIVHGDPIPLRENAIVMANHQSMSDVLILLCLGLQAKQLAHTKWLVKDALKWVPFLGWGMYLAGCIFLKRDWAKDEQNIKRTFARYAESSRRFWVISFPEGTRLTPKKLAQSQKYAQERGVPPTQKVMLPRPSGFIASLEGLRERVQAVYSVTLRYPGDRATGLFAIMRGDVDQVDVYFKRIPIAQMPKDRAAISEWLTKEFYAKDAILQA